MQAEALPPAGAMRRYAAFISYSHRDRKWAEWLHKSIETYRIPKDLAAERKVQGRPTAGLHPIFLDRAELPSSSDLAATVREALEQSAYLIVVCSPDAARSRWVNEEVRAYKALGGAGRILCLIVAGEPSVALAARADETDCFPPALRYAVDSGQITSTLASEPLAADVRPGKDDKRAAVLKIVAGLLQIPLDRLMQREQRRRQRRLAIVATAAAVGCLAFGTLAALALVARNDAERERIVAEQHSLTARRTADFLKSLFTVSDPTEARGNSITAREVLDRGVQHIDTQLKSEPLVRADLTTTLGEVYTSLGLLQEGERLLKSARAVPSQPDSMAARQAVALGEVEYSRRNLESALESLRQASHLINRSPDPDSALRARMLSAFGDVYLAKDDYANARNYFNETLTLANRAAAPDRGVITRALEGVAQADLYDQKLDAAEQGFRRALATQVAAGDEINPRTAEILNELGSLEYMRGRLEAAAGYFQRTATIERRVLGEHHPEYAITINNLARVHLERRHFAEARNFLAEALAARSVQTGENDDQLTFVFSNLALANMGLGDNATAEPWFEKALHTAIVNKHRLHGPILTDLADLECRTGRFQQGLKRLDEARPIVAARYPDDLWRVALVDNVRGGCLLGLKHYADAEPLLTRSTAVLLKKWKPGTLYGYDAIERALRLYRATRNDAKIAEYMALAGR